ncbi:MAG: hypothetical protein JXJ04_12020 [Spirochaetales bacterium]|nr:hypothetical protein [Spirochaetales bacterium]
MKENNFFNHIGISIKYISDINDFYIDILKMNVEKKFILDMSLAEQIFDVQKEIEIITIGKDNLKIELFISISNLNNYSHICISVDDRNEIIEKVKQKNYPYKIIKKNPFDMVFIKDKSNNLFEIKQY